MSINENYNNILSLVQNAEKNANRSKDSVRLMAVSKFHSTEEIEEAIKAGAKLFGENRVQEAEKKFPSLVEKYPFIELHMIGSLQRNKVKNIVKFASCIQSVDRIELIEEIEKQCAKIDKKIKIMFEFHTGEESKAGFLSFEELKEGVKKATECPHIIPCGFMTMAPFTDDKDLIISSFRKLKDAAEKIKLEFSNLPLTELSMGMSGDFELAIKEGSTMVRVGTAIFGQRQY